MFASVFSESPWNEPWSEGTARTRLSEIRATPNFLGLVCVADDAAVIGLALGCVWQQADDSLYYLYEMCVAAETRGRGVGRRLLERLEERLRE